MAGIGMEGIIKKSHYDSQRIWYKPWTWFKKPVRVIDEIDVHGFSLVQHPVDPKCIIKPL